jgi:hypothetical protein
VQYQELWHAKLHVAEGGGDPTLSQTVFCLANIWGCTELVFYLGGGGSSIVCVAVWGVGLFNPKDH